MQETAIWGIHRSSYSNHHQRIMTVMSSSSVVVIQCQSEDDITFYASKDRDSKLFIIHVRMSAVTGKERKNPSATSVVSYHPSISTTLRPLAQVLLNPNCLYEKVFLITKVKPSLNTNIFSKLLF